MRTFRIKLVAASFAIGLLSLSGCSLERWDAMIDVKVPGDAKAGEWVRVDGTPYRVVESDGERLVQIRVGFYFSPESCKKAALAEYERRQESALPAYRYRCERLPIWG